CRFASMPLHVDTCSYFGSSSEFFQAKVERWRLLLNMVFVGRIHFTGQIVELRDATSEEPVHGHVHGPHGHHH
ncbi:MAG: hypothetical protein PHU33_13180, partial [Bacteroidales bacterium]|nr:hypothetical protein [Bacteroidales bacterium]